MMPWSRTRRKGVFCGIRFRTRPRLHLYDRIVHESLAQVRPSRGSVTILLGQQRYLLRRRQETEGRCWFEKYRRPDRMPTTQTSAVLVVRHMVPVPRLPIPLLDGPSLTRICSCPCPTWKARQEHRKRSRR